MIYDIIIIGAGPAGLAAGIYAGRQGLKTLIVSADMGGQISKSLKIDNYPGLPGVSGKKLSEIMKKQAETHGVKFEWKLISKLNKANDIFKLTSSDNNTYQAKSVIIAFGKSPRKLDIPGEDKLVGKGVGYCFICDLPFFTNKTVSIVGGGNSALQSVLAAKKIAKKIYLIHRSDKFKAEKNLIEQVKELKKNKQLELVTNSEIKKIIGDKFVESIIVYDKNRSKKREIKTDGVFIEIGFVVKNKLIEKFADLDQRGEIKTNLKCETKTPGLFIAGDISSQSHDQAIIAAGQGASAAITAASYLRGQKGSKI